MTQDSWIETQKKKKAIYISDPTRPTQKKCDKNQNIFNVKKPVFISEPIKPNRFDLNENIYISKYKKFIENEDIRDEREMLKRSFPLKNCLPSIMKDTQKEIIDNREYDIYNFQDLRNFWKKFNLGENIKQKDIEKLSWISKLVFEAYLIRKEYCSPVDIIGEEIWKENKIQEIQKKLTPKRFEENIKFILKLIFNILQQEYKSQHFEYKKNNKEFFNQIPKKFHEKMGFLHMYFIDVAKRNNKNLKFFEDRDQNIKDKDSLRNFLKHVFQSRKFLEKIESLINEKIVNSNRGIIYEFSQRTEKKIKNKCRDYNKLFKRVDDRNDKESFKWIRYIQDDLLYNPKCKLPWTKADILRALAEFRQIKEDVLAQNY